MSISAIAAVGQNFELGKGNDLIWRSKEDLAHFKEFTMGKALIVGAKTYLSMPPMKGRKVICIGRSFLGRSLRPKQETDVFIGKIETGSRFLDKVFLATRGYKVVLVGGAETYQSFAPFVTELVLTHFPYADPDADTYFPKDSYKELLEGAVNTRTLVDNIVVSSYYKANNDVGAEPMREVE